jgi:hypothetical protein
MLGASGVVIRLCFFEGIISSDSMVRSRGQDTFRVTIIYGWDSVARDLGLLTISDIVGKLIL